MASFLTGLVIAIVAAVAAVVFAPEIAHLRERLLVRGGHMAGAWRQIVPPSSVRPVERIDEIEVHHKRDGRIVAFGKRIQPPDEHRNWRFDGHVSGRILVATFRPGKGSDDPESFGVILLRLDSTSHTEQWRGGYIRPSDESVEWSEGNTVLTHELMWERVRH